MSRSVKSPTTSKTPKVAASTPLTVTQFTTALAELKGSLLTEMKAATAGQLTTAVTEMRGELKTGMTEMRGELKTGMTEMRGELATAMSGMRDFVLAAVKNTEMVLRQEFRAALGDVRDELRSEFRTALGDVRDDLRSEFRSGMSRLEAKIDLTQFAVTEHSKFIKAVDVRVDDHERRLTTIERRTAS